MWPFRKKNPKEKASRLLSKGDRLLQKGKAERALKKFRKALSLDSTNPLIYEKLIVAKDLSQENWGADDFTESLEWVMKRQELENPELVYLYDQLSEVAQQKSKTQILALTGGFATGKTTVGKMFESFGIPCCDADQIAHDLLKPGTATYEAVLAAFGKNITTPTLTLPPQGGGDIIDRHKLADIIFADPEKRKILEGILHPQIGIQMNRWIADQEKRGTKIVLLEIPLLFETNWEKQNPWDAILVVTCSEETELQRAQAKGFSQEEVTARLKAQLPLDEKEKRATTIIHNDGSLEETRKQVEQIVYSLLASSPL